LGLESTPEEYVEKIVTVFREVRRVLRDDGTLWLNLGDSYSRGERVNNPNDHKRGTGFHEEITEAGGYAQAGKATGLESKQLIGVPWRVAFALQADGWHLRQDIIWCLSGGAAVYARTQKGDMPIMVKDLVRLRPDTVQLWNGTKWTQALGWSRSADTDGAIELELRSGERVGCTRGHQWPTKRGLLRADELQAGDVIDTTRLPAPDTPAEPDALGLDVAWLCGLYLAEGSMSGDTVQIAGHANETGTRLEKIERVAASFHGSVNAYVSANGNGATINMEGPIIAAVIRAYVHGDNAHNKGLKVRVWQRSDVWLRAFLEGYLAGDGHHDVANDRWRLGFCRNDRLADDFRTLAARMGLPIRLAAVTVTGFGREWPAYRGDIRLLASTHHNARDAGEIVTIRASRARQFWDIGVADDPHTFALASGVLTHNSKPNPMPESVKDRCTKSHEYIFLLTKSERYYFDQESISEKCSPNTHARLSQDVQNQVGSTRVPGKTNGNMKAVGRKFDPGANNKNNPSFDTAMAIMPETRNKRSVWTVTTQGFDGAHFATFPPALIEPCILGGSKVGDVVLDPFAGSGTTGSVAEALGRQWLLIELNEEYAKLCADRTRQMGIVMA
jgi:DNA modification methylase